MDCEATLGYSCCLVLRIVSIKLDTYGTGPLLERATLPYHSSNAVTVDQEILNPRRTCLEARGAQPFNDHCG